MATLTNEKRAELMDKLANQWTDNADLDCLMEFFYDAQMEYLDDLPEPELLELLKENDID